ncbi:MAG: hypothetical protein HeimC3_13270 [Candidatus Heimdallarchaeota archaeon LC_3]|nr:MAG: hypothetical protein HeimC3_13270 [Candidatus Heimdallarchaeota archaeon LC_3]
MSSDTNQKVYRSAYVGKTRIWVFFVVFLLLNGLFLLFFAMIRFDDAQSADIPIYFLPFDIFTWGWIIIGIILQFLIIYLGFIFKFFREPKYEIYPNDKSTEKTVYHYFSIEQLIAFLDAISTTLDKKPIKYHKVYVLKNPVSKMFSFSLFRRKYLVLDPALLQIAQTQELRAFLVQNMLLVSTRLSVIRMVHSQAQYLWFVILIPIGYRFLREIFLYLIDLSRLDPNYFLATLFIFVAIIFTVIILRPIHLRVLRFSSSRVVFLTDILSADVVGKRAMINMLVKQGQRWEIISVLVEEFRWLEQLEKGTLYSYEEYRLLELVQKFPLDQLNTELAKRMAPYIYMREKLRNLKNYYETDILEIEFTIQKAQEKLQEKRKLYIEDIRKKYEKKQIERIPNDARLAFQTGIADWTQMDVNHDSILSEKEIELLIDSVSKKKKKKDRKKLFAYEGQSSDFSGVEARILNIFQNVKDM